MLMPCTYLYIYKSERESDLADISNFSAQLCMSSGAVRDSDK